MTQTLDMTDWNDKDSKKPECRVLYEEHDYVTAYGLHSDLRVERDGPTGAIGRADEWESHGLLQLEFLRSRGLRPESLLLDLGCGSGRLARRAVPFLDPGNYTGLDISRELLKCARRLSEEEGWRSRKPLFLFGDGSLDAAPRLGYDMIWAHSVFTHSPPEVVRSVFRDLETMGFGQFFFTYKFAEDPRRSGLKQFQYPPRWFIQEVRSRR